MSFQSLHFRPWLLTIAPAYLLGYWRPGIDDVEMLVSGGMLGTAPVSVVIEELASLLVDNDIDFGEAAIC